MKITFLTPTLKITGGNVVLRKYAEHLASCGHTVTIVGIHPDLGYFDKGNFAVKNIITKCKPFWHHLFFDLFLLSAYIKSVPKSDIVIPIFSPLLIHAIVAKQIRLTRKVCFFYQDAKNIRYFGMYNWFIFKLPFVFKNLDFLIAISEPLRDYFLGSKKLPNLILPNGIDSDIFYNQPNILKKNEILFVGTKRKRLSLFIKIANEYQKIDDTIQFIIVCPHQVQQKLPKNCQVIDVKNNRQLLSEIYNRAKLYIGLSKIESFGLTALEAMACGTPVLLVKNEGVLGYCKDQVNSIYIRKDTPQKVAVQIYETLNNDELMQLIAKKGIITANNFSWEKSITLLELCLRKLND